MGALALTMLIALQIIVLRVAARRRTARDNALKATWRPLLNRAVLGDEPAELPRLAKRDIMPFLVFWLQLQQSVRGDAAHALNQLAQRLGCAAVARRLLVNGDRAARIVAILVLGHLRDRGAWPELMRVARQLDSGASILALWALAQIDPAAAAEELALPLLRRSDWPLAQLANILQTDRAVWEPALGAAIQVVEPARLPDALRLLAALRLALPRPVLERMLAHPDANVVAVALRLATSPEAAPLVRPHLHHPDWQVRVQAARSIGPIAGAGDVAPLQALLADPQWWVRYRAAQTLATLPFLRRDELAELASGDRFAADIMRQVLAEQEAS
jgi:HEAT repeat protein